MHLDVFCAQCLSRPPEGFKLPGTAIADCGKEPRLCWESGGRARALKCPLSSLTGIVNSEVKIFRLVLATTA